MKKIVIFRENVFLGNNLEEEGQWVATSIYLINSIEEMLLCVGLNHALLQMMEIYHTLRNKPKYSNMNENSEELQFEWRNRVMLSIFLTMNKIS